MSLDEWKYDPALDLGLARGDRLRSLHRESGLLETASHVVWWTLVRLYLSIYHRFKILGPGQLPTQAPFVLVANHASHLDALSLAAPFPWRLRDRIFPIAAGDTFFERAPVAFFAAFALNALPLWRKRCDPNDIRELRRRLIEEPCGYVLFPEGTRTRTGAMGRFRKGLGMLVAGSDVPVIPCHLRGAFEAFPAHRRFPRPGRIGLSVGTALRFREVSNTPEGWVNVAARAEEEVRRLG
jgi:1-acyl-sn-glycerol-3-phosphate acyltransferase